LAAVSRMFGGLRTGDLHALRWGIHIETETFTYGVAPRQKTATPQPLEIPEMLRPSLRRWWETHGSPDDGPVFPIRIGDKAGEARLKASHASALRSDMMRMLGVEYRSERDEPTGPRTAWALKPVDQWTRRERELFSETSYSLPLDFHSFRRSFNTALADAGVNIQVAMRLAGHTSTSAHMRYVMSRAYTMPEAALPRLNFPKRHGPCLLDEPKRAKYGRPQGDLNPRYWRERPESWAKLDDRDG
jgi:integrase